MPESTIGTIDLASVLLTIKRRLIVIRAIYAGLCAAVIASLGALLTFETSILLAGTLAVFILIVSSVFVDPTFRAVTSKNFLLHLNRVEPCFEESAQLLSLQRHDLPVLQKFQWDKVYSLYFKALDAPALWLPPLRLKPRFIVAALLFVGVVGAVKFWLALIPHQTDPSTDSLSPAPSLHAATLLNIQARITPPSYTRLPAYISRYGNLKIPQESTVDWTFKFSRTDGEYFIKIGDIRPQQLKKDESGVFTLSQTTRTSVLYQILHRTAAGEFPVGDIHTITVERDRKPVIRIIEPTTTTLEFAKNGTPAFISTVQITDDYAISDTQIVASVAKGTGEAVKFRDEVFEFDASSGETNDIYHREWDLRQLGMEPGDELYFSVHALDNKEPDANSSKSATVIVRWLDEAENTMAAEGIVSDFVPEYFKSQRQIIIETEQLIADRPALDKKAFSEASYGLGQAQSDLKQRYGQYLGDEFGEGPAGQLATSHTEAPEQAGHDDHEEDDHDPDRPEVGHRHDDNSSASTENPAQQLIARFGHSHEDADIGPIAKRDPKTLMKKAVSTMWQAELHLMMAEPEKALPFEYEALKFLKLAKQADRIYVKRLGFEPPPVTEERRLKGELQDIQGYEAVVSNGWEKTEQQKLVRDAFRLLNTKNTLSAADRETLSNLSRWLQGQAQERPALLIHAATTEKILIANSLSLPGCADCVSGLKSTLWSILPLPESTPSHGYGYFSSKDPLFIVPPTKEATP